MMAATSIPNRILMATVPCLKLKMRCSIRKAKSKSIGINAQW